MKRTVLLLLLSACYTGQQQPPAQPMAQQGQYPQEGWAPPQGGEYFCAAMQSAAALGSICFPQYERCETERREAEADGARTGACVPQSPVACFQLQADANPAMEMCAASIEDCDLWRHIDQQKNGQTAVACEWRHGPGLPQ